MNTKIAVAALLALVSVGAAGGLVHRVRRDRSVPWVLAAALCAGGAAAGVGTFFVERAILRFAELSIEVSSASGTTGAAALAALLLLVSPLEEAAKVLVVWPTLSMRRLDGPGLGVTFAVCVASGFAAAETAAYITTGNLGALGMVRAAAGVPAHAFCAGVWGYALGHRAREGGRWFGPAWIFAVLVHALYDHIVFGRGPGMLAIALPMLAAMALVAWSALRDIAPAGPEDRPSLSLHLPIHIPEPPSLGTVRRALQRTEQPLLVRWIGFGALVNVGAVIVCVGGAVVIARRLGIDLSVADEADMRSNGPLALLGTAVLTAFPLAGFLLSRASGVHTVLEPALAAALAMAIAVAFLSVTAPSAVIVAVAIAPIAFGLACGGAWFGMDS